MNRSLIALGFVATLAISSVADAGYYVVHVQGRGWKNWTAEKPSMGGWTNITLAFNGSAKLNGNETNVTVRNAINTYCSGGNYCIVHCYSAGCLRTLKAVSDLRASGYTLPGRRIEPGVDRDQGLHRLHRQAARSAGEDRLRPDQVGRAQHLGLHPGRSRRDHVPDLRQEEHLQEDPLLEDLRQQVRGGRDRRRRGGW
jgi:hypothetical protein